LWLPHLLGTIFENTQSVHWERMGAGVEGRDPFCDAHAGRKVPWMNTIKWLRAWRQRVLRYWGKVDELGEYYVGPLAAQARSRKPNKRMWAVDRLREIRTPRAAKPMCKLLQHENSYVRQIAAGALGPMKDLSAVGPLIASLGDSDSDVRSAAAKSLGQLGDPRAVAPLIMCLKAPGEWDLRCRAARALGHIGDSEAVPELIASLSDDNTYVRDESAIALATMRDPRTVEPLNDFARGESDRLGIVQSEAIMAKLTDGTLAVMLTDEKMEVRAAAAQALAARGWQPPDDLGKVRYLIALERWDEVRFMGDAAVEAAVALLRDKKSSVRSAAYRVLEELEWRPEIGEDRALALLVRADWHALCQLGRTAADVMLACKCLYDEDAEIRAGAAITLGALKEDRAVVGLLYLLKSEVPQDLMVGVAVVRALGRIGDPEANPPLRKKLEGLIRLSQHYIEFEAPSIGNVAEYAGQLPMNPSFAKGLVAEFRKDLDSLRSKMGICQTMISEVRKAIAAIERRQQEPQRMPEAKAAPPRRVALAVVVSAPDGYIIDGNTGDVGPAGQVTEDMVRTWIEQDLSRYPDLRSDAEAIQEIVSVSEPSIRPEDYAQEVSRCYLKHMLAKGWVAVTELHIFEKKIGPATVYVAYGMSS